MYLRFFKQTNHTIMLSFWEKESFLEYDYLIVGGGLVGLSTAAALIERKPKAQILVLERGIFPSGASTKNAGFACFGSLTELQSEIEETNTEAMLTRVERRWKGLSLLKKRLGEDNIGLEKYGGYELIFEKDIAKIGGLEQVNQALESVFPEPVFKDATMQVKEFGFAEGSVKKLIFNPYEAQVHTGKMMKSLQKYVQSRGVSILTNIEVKGFESTENGQVSVIVKNKEEEFIHFKAHKVAVCTNAFTPHLLPDLVIKPGRGQVLITSPIPQLKFKGTFHFEEGFYYFRDLGERVLFGGGRNQDFDTESTTELALNAKIQADLIQKLNEVILPNIDFKIEQQWSGVMGFTADRNPILREAQPNIWVGAGLNGMGVALGSLLGEDLAEAIIL